MTKSTLEYERPSMRLRWQLTTIACMYSGYAALILCRTSINVAAPDLVDDPSLGIDEASFGALLGWGAGGALAGKLINGMLADIVGGRRLFLFALTAMAAATIAFGLSSAHLLFMLLNFAAQLVDGRRWPRSSATGSTQTSLVAFGASSRRARVPAPSSRAFFSARSSSICRGAGCFTLPAASL